MLSERDERIRRYVEGELTPEGRTAFEKELATDPALRSEVDGLRALVAEARSLPPHQAPPDLVARVRARAQLGGSGIGWEPSGRRRRALLMWVPATAAAAVLLALALFGLQTRLHPTLAPTRRPELTASVTFRLHAPGAHEVAVVGDFNHWQVGAIRLTDPDGNGTWSATVRVPRGRHQYQFVIDGKQWLPDPEAPLEVDDGFGNKNSVLEASVTTGDPDRRTL